MYIVLGGYLHILGSPSVQSCCTLSISASYHVFVYDRYRKSRLVGVLLSDLDLAQRHRRNSTSHPAGPYGRFAPKNGKSIPHCWGREVSTQCAQQVANSAVTALPLVVCVVWNLLFVSIISHLAG